MRTKLLSVIALFALLCSCGDPNPPVTPGTNPNNPPGNTTNNNSVSVEPVADFSYTKSQPCYVHFTNTSTNATSYEWDFGDGKKSTEKSPTHKYSSKGVYEVTLKAVYTSYSKHDICKKTITVKEPTTCYITGIVYDQIPNDNEYYNIRFTDNYLLFETLYWYTDWVLLSRVNTPYTYNLKSKKQIDFTKKEYVMRLYKNNNNSGTGTQTNSWIVQPNYIKSNYLESVTGTSNNSKIKLLLEWKD